MSTAANRVSPRRAEGQVASDLFHEQGAIFYRFFDERLRARGAGVEPSGAAERRRRAAESDVEGGVTPVADAAADVQVVADRLDPFVDQEALEPDGLGLLGVAIGRVVGGFEQKFDAGLVVLDGFVEVSLLVQPFAFFNQILAAFQQALLKN